MSRIATPHVTRRLTPLPLNAARQTVMQTVYERLLHEILTLQLKPRDVLSENSLAERLGVSRTPVREALVVLATKRLVDIYPQRKTMVAPLRFRDLRKSQFIRESLEISLIRRAIEAHHSMALAVELQHQTTIQQQCIEAGDHDGFYESDETFHRLIVRYAGLPELWSDIADAKLHMDRARQLTLKHIESLGALREQHIAIAQAIGAGSIERAEAAVREHLRRIFQDLSALALQFPEYFEAESPDGLARG
jgi:DNA-binding GntR family transcriptional regulator